MTPTSRSPSRRWSLLGRPPTARARVVLASIRGPVLGLAFALGLLVPSWQGLGAAAAVDGSIRSAGSLPTGVAGSPSPTGAPVPVGVWPLQPPPEVVHAFDPPDSTWGAGHRGVDLLGTPGQQVHSALPGTVSYVGMIAGKRVVTVDHGGTRTTYEPVISARRVGDRVLAGTVIGTLAAAPSHCAPRSCLHWGWIRGDVYLDPLQLVGAGPVRLLPLWRTMPAVVPAG